MLGNEPLSKWSLVTNSQSKLWGDMLMKCQSCHFISSNYRLACRPFNDHLQLCLQCIRGSAKSLSPAFTLSKSAHACLHYHELAQTLISTCKKKKRYTKTQKYTHTPPTPYSLYSFPKNPHFLFICRVQNKPTHWAGFSRPANQNLNRTFVITIALYLSISLRTFKTIPSCPCLYFCNHFRSRAHEIFHYKSRMR